MTTLTTTPTTSFKTVPCTVEKVLAYEHPGLLERLQKKLNISHEDAVGLFNDTKRFLYLCGTSEENEYFAPPEQIDEAWHQFILFTREYARFCQEYFGRFIHHSPNTSFKRGEYGLLPKTLKAARSKFGMLSKFWGEQSKSSDGSCSDCSQCSGSTNCQD